MQRHICLGFVPLCLLAAAADATAQGVPAVERGTAAGFSAVLQGQAELERQSKIQSQLLAIQRERLAIQRENEKGNQQNSAIQGAVPRNVAAYFKWSEEQAAIKLWPGDEPFAVTYGTFPETIGVGSLGFIPRIKVIQVIDDNSARVDLKWFAPQRWRTVGPGGGEFYKLGVGALENVVLRDMPTSGMVDDAEYKLGKVLEITGTERYATITGGTKTVYVVQPIDVEIYRNAFDESERVKAASEAATVARLKNEADKEAAERKEVARLEAEAKRQKRLEIEKPLTRTWSDATGKFSITGFLVDILPGPKAKIRRDDGAIIEVEFSKLSSADRKWIIDEAQILLVIQKKQQADRESGKVEK